MSSFLITAAERESAAKRAAADKAAEDAEREATLRRITAVRASADGLPAMHEVDSAARTTLLQACDTALANAQSSISRDAQNAKANSLEERLDALRAEIVEHAFQDISDHTRAEISAAAAAAKKAARIAKADQAAAKHAAGAAEHAAQAEIHETARAAKEKLHADAAASALAAAKKAAKAKRQGDERAAQAVLAACAQLAAIVPSLPGASKSSVARELREVALEASTSPQAAFERLMPLQTIMMELISSERTSRQRLIELSRRCVARLGEIAADSEAPAVTSQAWELRTRFNAALSDSPANEAALTVIANDLDVLADACARESARAAQEGVGEAIMAALQRNGYDVGRVTDGSTFVAGGSGGIGVQFHVGGGTDPQVKAEIVRLAAAPAAAPEDGCALLDSVFEELSRDNAMPLRLRELARHLPRPLDEVPLIDAASVGWRACEPSQAAQDAPRVRHLNLDGEPK